MGIFKEALIESAVRSQSHAGKHQIPSHCGGACERNWKIAFSSLLFAEVLIASYLIYRFMKQENFNAERFSKAFSFIDSGTAGVFLGASLLHLFPDSASLLTAAELGQKYDKNDHPFPAANVVILVIYLAVLLCDRVLRLPDATDCSDKLDDVLSCNEDVYERRDTMHIGHDTVLPTMLPNEEYIRDSASVVLESEVYNRPYIVRCGFRTYEFRAALLTTICAVARTLVEVIALGTSSHIACFSIIFMASFLRIISTSAQLCRQFISIPLTSCAHALLISGLAFTVPIGVGIGAGMRLTSAGVRGAVIAIAAASFLYFGGFETPAEEFIVSKQQRLGKYGAMLLGASVIVVITSALAGIHVF